MDSNAPNPADWITAGASVFAAIGTVGAVVLALWQSSTRDRRSLELQCSHAVAALDSGPIDLLALKATNVGYRPVTVTQAYIRTDDDRRVMSRFVTFGGGQPLPTVLNDGESVDVYWDLAKLREFQEEDGLSAYVAVLFQDAQGNSYLTPYPGFVERRRLVWDRGFRRRIEYVPRKAAQGRRFWPSKDPSDYL